MKSYHFPLLLWGILLAGSGKVALPAATPAEIGQSSVSDPSRVEQPKPESLTDFDSESGTLLAGMLESPAGNWVEFDQGDIEAANSGRNWDDNLRIAIDLSSRYVVLTHGKKNFSQQFIGIDMHKVLVGPDGDWGTFMFQGYLTRINNQERHAAA
ncbi:MAG: hypothetical protein VB858_08540, partial [Planctomycetaceae bacterium]